MAVINLAYVSVRVRGGKQSFKGIRVFSEVLYKNMHTCTTTKQSKERKPTNVIRKHVQKKQEQKWLNNSVTPHIYSYR